MDGLILSAVILMPLLVSLAVTKFGQRISVGLLVLAMIPSLTGLLKYLLNGSSLLASGPSFKFFTLSLQADLISIILVSMVSFIGLVVLRHSERNLEDDPGQKRFQIHLGFAIASIIFMLLAGNLFFIFGTWFSASYFLHQLLTHYDHRKEALRAADQKFWVSRLGDFFVLLASGLIAMVCGTVELAGIFLLVEDQLFIQEHQLELTLSAVFLVLGAMTKSAQFPFHYWLPNTMETPASVSAVMHAGIINAGGYLVIRMSPFLAKFPVSLSVLVFFGTLTVLYGCFMMLAQTNVKKNLAYSTIAQMGFMMIQCGVGAFGFAVLHIIGHSAYKAYSFLSSASQFELGYLNRYFPEHENKVTVWSPFIAFALSFLVIFIPLLAIGFEPSKEIGKSFLFFILSLAMAQLYLFASIKKHALLLASVIGGLYLVFSLGITHFVRENAAIFSIQGHPFEVTILLLSGIFLFIFFLFQNNLSRISQSEWGLRLYLKSLNGSMR